MEILKISVLPRLYFKLNCPEIVKNLNAILGLRATLLDEKPSSDLGLFPSPNAVFNLNVERDFSDVFQGLGKLSQEYNIVL